jgi:hypothetical protein
MGQKNRVLIRRIAARPTCRHCDSGAMVSRAMFGELAAFLRRLQTDCLNLRPVAGIKLSVLAAYEQPASTPSNGFKEVQRIHGINQSPQTIVSAFICTLAVAEEVSHFGGLIS